MGEAYDWDGNDVFLQTLKMKPCVSRGAALLAVLIHVDLYPELSFNIYTVDETFLFFLVLTS